MRAFLEFLKKEGLELSRTGKLLILGIIFLVFGISNPAIAKLTPWLMEMMSEDLSGLGMTVSKVVVNDLSSWTQFFKNVSMILIVFLVIFSGTITTEYQKGTLIPILTKGIRPHTVLAAKTTMILICWTAGYWCAVGITYGYNACFWGNIVANHIAFALFSYYIFGVWIITVLILMSSILQSNIGVLLGTGVVFGVDFVGTMFQKSVNYLPGKLTASGELLAGVAEPEDYGKSIVITMMLSVILLGIGCYFMEKKKV